MDLRGRRNNRKWKAVARIEFYTLIGAEKCIASCDTAWCENVALFTICVGKESEIS
jgi:hypothetical protein